jgi:hypothetical protein
MFQCHVCVTTIEGTPCGIRHFKVTRERAVWGQKQFNYERERHNYCVSTDFNDEPEKGREGKGGRQAGSIIRAVSWRQLFLLLFSSFTVEWVLCVDIFCALDTWITTTTTNRSTEWEWSHDDGNAETLSEMLKRVQTL